MEKPELDELVGDARRQREDLLAELERSSERTNLILKKLSAVEDLLLRHDDKWNPPSKRFSRLNPSDAAIIVMIERGTREISREELIEQLLSQGAGADSRIPRAEIERSLQRSSALTYDDSTGVVSLKEY